MIADNFTTSVFINCPFDDAYIPILHAIVFTVLACDHTPCSVLQERDAGEIRLRKIQRLIQQSRFGIHDISRTQLDPISRLPRFNMPFELGLDIGARQYGSGRLKSKIILIFDELPNRYQQSLSDISGQDISSHGNEVSQVITKIRSWLNAKRADDALPLPGNTLLIQRYDLFQIALPNLCGEAGLDHANLEFNDLSYFVAEWISQAV